MNYKTILAILGCGTALTFTYTLLPQAAPTQISPQTKQDQARLHKSTTKSVAAVDRKMQEKQQRLRLQRLSKQPMTARFQNTAILGDSLAEAFLDYRLLPATNVLAIRGRRTDNCDDEINSAIALAPRHVFLTYGMNDLGYCRGNAALFTAQYEKQIKKLQRALPDTKLYVNSLIPMDASAIQQNPVYKHYTDFNKALRKMCKKLHITYIDNTKLMDWKPSIYEQDGIHPKYAYYPIWLAHMASEAGL